MSDHSGLSWKRLLGSLSANDGEAIHEAGAILELPAGATLFREGEESSCMYVILRGRVQLEFSGIPSGRVLGENEVLGDLTLLLGRRKRTATAVALDATRLLSLDQGGLDVLTKDNPKLLLALFRNIATYLLDSERRLIDDLQRKCAELDQTLDFLRRTQRDLEVNELMAHTDELTGLYNRRCLNEQLPSFLEKSEAGAGPVAVVGLDLDELKRINDEHGHSCGDAALQHLAAILRGAVRRADLPCRVGGDEFILVLPEIEEEFAKRRALEILRRVEKAPLEWGDGAIRLTVSVGGALHRPGEPGASLLERADRSLYAVKRAGGAAMAWDGEGPVPGVAGGV